MPKGNKKSSVGRAWLAAILIIIGALIAPFAIIAHWATAQVSNTQAFVDTVAPLAENPEVQDLIITQVNKAIDDNLKIEDATGSLLDGLSAALNLPDAAQKALGLVKSPIASGVKGLINNVVTDIVRSPEFATAWRKTVEVTHTQLVGLLEGNSESALQLENNGELMLEIQPLVAEVKKTLVNQGMGFANAIPNIKGSIKIATIPELATARVIYKLGVGVGTWLPWIAAILITLGALIANRRPRTTMVIGVVMAIEMAALATTFALGDVVISAATDPSISAAASAIYSSVVDYVIASFIAFTVLGVIIAFAGWSFGESATAARMRAWFSKQFDALRSVIAPRSSGLNETSQVLHRIRFIVRFVVIAGLALWYGLAEPITVGSTIGFTIAALVVLFVFEILQREVVPAGKASASATQKRTPAHSSAAKVVAQKPAAKKPAAKKPTAKKPAAQAGTASKSRSSSR